MHTTDARMVSGDVRTSVFLRMVREIVSGSCGVLIAPLWDFVMIGSRAGLSPGDQQTGR